MAAASSSPSGAASTLSTPAQGTAPNPNVIGAAGSTRFITKSRPSTRITARLRRARPSRSPRLRPRARRSITSACTGRESRAPSGILSTAMPAEVTLRSDILSIALVLPPVACAGSSTRVRRRIPGRGSTGSGPRRRLRASRIRRSSQQSLRAREPRAWCWPRPRQTRCPASSRFPTTACSSSRRFRMPRMTEARRSQTKAPSIFRKACGTCPRSHFHPRESME